MGQDILIVDFDILMNYDYAYIKTMSSNYASEQVSDISDVSLEDIYESLVNRDNINPLHLILSEDIKDSADSLLEELKDKYNDEIMCNLITNVNVFNVCNEWYKNKMVELTVCCKNQTEQQIIKELFGYDTILEEDVNYNDYDTFMVNYYKKIVDYPKRYTGKSVYLAMTHYNLFLLEDQYVLPADLLFVSMNKIGIRLISLFNKKEDINNVK